MEQVIEGGKIVFVTLLLGGVFGLATLVYIVSQNFGFRAYESFNINSVVDPGADFTAMAVYGKPIPMPNIVASIATYGEPDTLCLQMEDIKYQYGGSPYPTAVAGTEQMQTLINLLKNYYGKKVYVYTASPNGDLQLCISELSHSSNPDGATGWD